jgi:single-strand DNA-binding protein
MSNINVVVLSGRLGADPEIRYSAKGNMVANFSLAINEVWNDEEGNRQERTNWVSAEVWGRLAEVAQEYLHKGDSVILSGRLRQDTWENEDGGKRSKLKVVVRDLQLPPKGGKPEDAKGEPQEADNDTPF